MFAKLSAFFQSPELVNGNGNAKAPMVSASINIRMLVNLAFMLNLWLFQVEETIKNPIVGEMLACDLGFLLMLRALLRAGYAREAGFCLIAGTWAVLTAVLVVGGTVRAPASGVFISLVVLAAIIFGWRGVWWTVAVNALTYGALLWGQIGGFLPTPVQDVSIATWLSLTIVLVTTAAFLGMALQHRDQSLADARQALSDRIRADSAESAARAKSAFLARMSHELRTPLHGILGYAELLSHELRQPEQREYSQIIHDAGTHLRQVIDKILDLAKIEAGRMELSIMELKLVPFIHDLAKLHSQSAQSKGLAFHLELDARIPEAIQTDATRLREILDNLLNNAVKFTVSGSISLNVTPARDGIEFLVRDTGRGINAADLENVFEPLRKIDRNAAQPGTGLGLAISRDLIELLGGTISVESSPGAGTTFVVWHPLATRKSEAAALMR